MLFLDDLKTFDISYAVLPLTIVKLLTFKNRPFLAQPVVASGSLCSSVCVLSCVTACYMYNIYSCVIAVFFGDKYTRISADYHYYKCKKLSFYNNV